MPAAVGTRDLAGEGVVRINNQVMPHLVNLPVLLPRTDRAPTDGDAYSQHAKTIGAYKNFGVPKFPRSGEMHNLDAYCGTGMLRCWGIH